MPPKFQVSRREDRTADGIVFDSKREMVRYLELKLAQKAGLIHSLMVQPSFPVKIGETHFCTYTADFMYIASEGNDWIIEDVKSTGTAKDAAYRLRKKAAELFHGIKIRQIIPDWKGPKLTKGRKRVRVKK